MTTIIKSNALVSPNVNAPLDLNQLLLDQTIVTIPGLTSWFRADYGVSDPGNGTEGSGAGIVWKDMINQIPLTAMSDTGPRLVVGGNTITGATWDGTNVTFTLSASQGLRSGFAFTVEGVTPVAYNGSYIATTGTSGTTIVAALVSNPGSYVSGGTLYSTRNKRPCLRFNPAGRNGRMYDAGNNNLWRAGANSTIVYTANDQGSNTAIMGTNRTSGYAQVFHSSANVFRTYMQAPNITTAGATVAAGQTHYGIFAYNFTTKEYDWIVNGTVIGTGVSPYEVLAGLMTVATASDGGTPNSRGDIYEIQTYSTCLGDDDLAAYLTRVKTYQYFTYLLGSPPV